MARSSLFAALDPDYSFLPRRRLRASYAVRPLKGEGRGPALSNRGVQPRPVPRTAHDGMATAHGPGTREINAQMPDGRFVGPSEIIGCVVGRALGPPTRPLTRKQACPTWRHRFAHGSPLLRLHRNACGVAHHVALLHNDIQVAGTSVSRDAEIDLVEAHTARRQAGEEYFDRLAVHRDFRFNL